MILPPPLDNDGLVVPHDHPQILNEDEVIRRISRHLLVYDAQGRLVISSMAFTASSEKSGKYGGMSVDLRQLIEKDGINPYEYVTTPRWMGSVLFKVADLRNMGYQVGYHPLPYPEPNPYHGEVWGKFSKSDRKQFKRLAVWFVPIPTVSIF